MTAADPPVLLLVPTERDAHYTHTVLGEAGIRHQTYRHLDALVEALGDATGTLVLTEAGLNTAGFDRLRQALRAQPSWSELPVVLLTDRGGDAPTIRHAVETLGNVTLLERPTRVDTLVSVLRSSLRARERQQQVREQLFEVERLNRKLELLAFYDTLTGLPNRDLMHDRLQQAMARVRRHGGALAVLFLDFDDFKVLNDSLGHDVGDRALQVIAERLRASLRDDDTAARQGGDEFVMVLTDLHGPEDAAAVARKVLRSVAEPFVLGEHEVRLTTSVGITPFSGGEETVDDLLKQADLAMYHAKTQGKRGYEFFTAGLQERAMERLTLERELRLALERQELQLHYQPRVRLGDEELVAFEALVRWPHPTRGLLGADAFVPLAEEAGLVWDLGRQVLERACRQMREWQGAGHASLRVSVNLSVKQLQHPALIDTVARVLADTGLAAHLLELEITESVTMSRVETFLPTLDALKRLGVRLSIDDFGTGYSSLEYLQRLPIDAIKIDRGFVGADDTSVAYRHNRAIVHAIVALGNNLGIELVGEGIETDAQRDYLTQLGCDEGQGFLFDAPLPPAEAATRLSRDASLRGPNA